MKEIDHLDPSAGPLVNIIQSAFLQAIKLHDHISLQTMFMKPPPLNNQPQHSDPLLINYHDPKTGLTAFHHAMRTKPLPSLETITMLFQAGADINAQTYYGRTALHHLARFGIDKDSKSWGIQKNNNPQQQSKTSTASVTAPSNIPEGVNVPEHLAMCASLLIRFGALVNIADPTGNTPLHFAAEFGGVHEVLEVLIMEGGADFGLRNKKGMTPLEVCKTEYIKNKMMQLEGDRKHNKTKSIISSLSGTIRPFDSASEYNRHSSVSRSTTAVATSQVEPSTTSFLFRNQPNQLLKPMASQKQLLIATIQRKKTDQSYQDYSDFEMILRAFFTYQTSFTDSIESSLACITGSIQGPWNLAKEEHVFTIQQLEKTISQLRFDLREAHEMFDATDQLVEKVMMAFREELEQVEQIHQSDWEMSELQHDKIEKLFDVFERIDGRFCQLEIAQDDLIGQIERLRKAAARKQQQLKVSSFEEGSIDIGDCVSHLTQSLLILQTVPIDQVLYLRDDRNRMYQDMVVVVDDVLEEIQARCKDVNEDDQNKLLEAKTFVEKHWAIVKELLTKDHTSTTTGTEEAKSPIPTTTCALTHSFNQPNTFQQKTNTDKPQPYLQQTPELNQLELYFDILHSNLFEIQKDIAEVTEHMNRLMQNKKNMYQLCLTLEKELNDDSSQRTQVQIQSELNQVLKFTQQLFDRQQLLDEERSQLLREYEEKEKLLDETRKSLEKVRPPILLQGLLEHLDTTETPRVRVEKDWKEDSNLVAEIVDHDHHQSDDTDESCASSTTSSHINDSCTSDNHQHLTVLQVKQLNTQCASKLSTLCYIARLDASLYCLKVLASHLISKSRRHLLEVQASLGQASNDLDETRKQMTQLYDDAAEVARQVFALKTELETIVRHRKEEVVKVWEVVDEVSEGVVAKSIQCQQQLQQMPQKQSQPQNQQQQSMADHDHAAQQKERAEEQDRYQWIVRELEQLQYVHESLEDAIEELKQEQAMISQTLCQLATVFIEPQVDKLVGQDEASLFSVSDRLAELMNRVKDSELGLRPASFWTRPTTTESNKKETVQQAKSTTTGVG